MKVIAVKESIFSNNDKIATNCARRSEKKARS